MFNKLGPISTAEFNIFTQKINWIFLQRLLTRSRTISFSHDVSHAGFVANKSRQVHRLARIILRKGLHLTAMPLRSFLRVEPHRPMPRGAELPVRLERERNLRRVAQARDQASSTKKEIRPP